jgi:hypothetical protein
MNTEFNAIHALCELHAKRLTWAKNQLGFPLDIEKLDHLDNTQLAILDQFSTRFAKSQDYMGAKLFPAVLERVKEPSEQQTFIDKLHRLEKIGAIPSTDQWLLLREMRNQFSHEYPDDPELQVAILNKAAKMTDDLLNALTHIKHFAAKYINPSARHPA